MTPLGRHHVADLTDSDRQLVDMVGQGYDLRDIAAELGVEDRQVRASLKRLCARLGAVNDASLVRRAYEQGVLRVGG